MTTIHFNPVNIISTPLFAFHDQSLFSKNATSNKISMAKKSFDSAGSYGSINTTDASSNGNSNNHSPRESFISRTSIFVEQREVVAPVVSKKKNSVLSTNTEGGKYKTELCKKWEATGHCPYYGRCRFAHGKHELVEKDFGKKTYKAKKCTNFHNNMCCNYGSRCMFAHEIRTIQEVVADHGFKSEIQISEIKKAGARRLACFSKLAERQ